jgi:hypothetical protein
MVSSSTVMLTTFSPPPDSSPPLSESVTEGLDAAVHCIASSPALVTVKLPL